VENSRELAALVPRSRYAELECGHVARIERPAELAELVADFVKEAA
jgi:hypothetical protein